jgi:hypothetical protein
MVKVWVVVAGVLWCVCTVRAFAPGTSGAQRDRVCVVYVCACCVCACLISICVSVSAWPRYAAVSGDHGSCHGASTRYRREIAPPAPLRLPTPYPSCPIPLQV